MAIQILELFGGVGAPRAALRNIGVPVKAIDYVEIDPKAVASYNRIFAQDLPYKTQNVIGYTLRPDILIHGSPCTSFSAAGHNGPASGANRVNRGAGGEKGSGTPSSLMWETVRIIAQLGEWKPRIVVWENCKNVVSKYFKHTFDEYLQAMEDLGYANSYFISDAREFGVPQARERVITVSRLGSEPFSFDSLERSPMRPLGEFLLPDHEVSDIYTVTQPSILDAIGKTGTIRRATVLDPLDPNEYARTITCRQDRTPTQLLQRPDGSYRYLTEQECWRLQGYTDADFFAARSAQVKNGKWYPCLYKQAGNSIPIPMLESLFRQILCDPLIAEEYQLSLAI